MKKSRLSEEQIIGVLEEQQAGLPVAEICRRHGISDATSYTWRSRFGGMDVSDAPSGGARRGELQAQEAPGRGEARRGHAARGVEEKLLTPCARRTDVSWAIEQKGYS